jgi:hypothetical protein
MGRNARGEFTDSLSYNLRRINKAHMVHIKKETACQPKDYIPILHSSKKMTVLRRDKTPPRGRQSAASCCHSAFTSNIIRPFGLAR